MKTYTKIILIAAGSLIILGCGLTGIAVSANGGFNKSFVVSNDDYEEVKYDFDEDINNLNINELSHDVKIEKSADSSVHVKVFDSKTYKHDVSVDGDTLKLSVNGQEGQRAWYTYIHVGISSDQAYMTTISLPEDQYNELLVKTSSADVCAESDFTFDKASVACSSGDITIMSKVNNGCSLSASSGDILADDCDPAELKVTATSGNITLKNIDNAVLSAECSSGELVISNGNIASLYAHTSSGDIKIDDLSIEGDITVEASSGDIIMNTISADKLTAEATSGNITFSSLSLKSESSITASSGDVDGKNSSLIVNASTNSGDVETAQVKDGTIINIKTSSGDITVK